MRAVDKLGPLAGLLRQNCDASGRADAKLLADLLRGMLRYDPAQRPSARACLRHEFFQVQAHVMLSVCLLVRGV